MNCIIDNVDFFNLEAQKYYAPPSSWSQEKKKDTAVSRIFSGEWWGSQKRDGAFMLFCKDMEGNMYLRPRAKNTKGEFVNKIDWVPHLHPFFESLPNGTCLLGELYLPRNEQAKSTTTIMNCLVKKAVERQEKDEDKLHYYIFDILADEGESYINMKAIDRFLRLSDYAQKYKGDFVEWAEYKNGKELWELLQNLLATGYEGIVITREDAPYQPGKRPSKDCLKVKKELQDTIDCFVLGATAPTKTYTGKEIEVWPYWFNELTGEKINGNEYFNEKHEYVYNIYVEGAPVVPVTKNWFYGWAGSLRLGAVKDGKDVEIGNLSGVTDEIKEHWKDYVGCPIEVTAMEIMDTGGLRHPKFVRFRDDILKSDCDWYKIFGGK